MFWNYNIIDEPIQNELLELDFGMHIDVENLLISQFPVLKIS